MVVLPPIEQIQKDLARSIFLYRLWKAENWNYLHFSNPESIPNGIGIDKYVKQELKALIDKEKVSKEFQELMTGKRGKRINPLKNKVGM
jgi:hypothetical protein